MGILRVKSDTVIPNEDDDFILTPHAVGKAIEVTQRSPKIMGHGITERFQFLIHVHQRIRSFLQRLI